MVRAVIENNGFVWSCLSFGRLSARVGSRLIHEPVLRGGLSGRQIDVAIIVEIMRARDEQHDLAHVADEARQHVEVQHARDFPERVGGQAVEVDALASQAPHSDHGEPRLPVGDGAEGRSQASTSCDRN